MKYKAEEMNLNIKDLLNSFSCQTEEIAKLVDDKAQYEAKIKEMIEAKEDNTVSSEYSPLAYNLIRTIAGHSQGISNMMKEGRSCDDVLMQLLAVKKILSKLTKLIYVESIQKIVETTKSEDTQSKLEELKVLCERYL